MDGTRMGSRSSTRHGPAAVFSGPVRRWKKAWAPVSSSSSSAASTSSSSSRVLLYKWVPLTPPGGKDEAPEEPAPPTVRYMPVSIVLAQRKEASKTAAEETETAAEKDEDEWEQPEAKTDDKAVSSEVKVSDSIVNKDRGRSEDIEGDTNMEETMEENGKCSPTEIDVVMTDTKQDEAEEEKPDPARSSLDLENPHVASDQSTGSEPVGSEAEQ
ncbi:hypothetical protein KP509_04G050800 [Ceratopteris richardii]|uniref:Uncharacterized protein n=1 Tax=Ceratopteris richardii TaxID=49495 RepID=A0A8T2V4P6_CERRI|nr:hypothetical protein KP509_04G050800 [Ceratopteris richardii]